MPDKLNDDLVCLVPVYESISKYFGRVTTYIYVNRLVHNRKPLHFSLFHCLNHNRIGCDKFGCNVASSVTAESLLMWTLMWLFFCANVGKRLGRAQSNEETTESQPPLH
jgi:hypothetical protein